VNGYRFDSDVGSGTDILRLVPARQRPTPAGRQETAVHQPTPEATGHATDAGLGRALLRRAGEDGPALLHGDRVWSYRELVGEGRRRAALFASLHDPRRPPHVGLLLDNDPEYLLWLCAAAISGTVVVGINSTYRGEQLAQLVDHTDCEVLVTTSRLAGLLDDAAHGVPAGRILVIDDPAYPAALERTTPAGDAGPTAAPRDDDLFLLIFTSGSTGLPKAVRCTQGRIGRTGSHVAAVAELGPNDVIYAPLPFFHAASLFTGWSAAVHAGIPIATRSRFSASATMDDVRRFGATVITYTGKVLNFILAVPDHPDDAEVPLRLAIGNEASEHDIREFARRFDCRVRDSYGSTEGVIIIRRDPSMPTGALGTAAPSVRVLDPDTGRERPRAVIGDDGKVANLDEAVGEIVDTEPSSGFEGYYRNEAATRERFRDGAYWSGDLAYRDAEGWLYFAGRSNDWLRVDGENFAAGPVEAILSRHPAVRSVAVYAVPDDAVGDRVMAAVALRAGATVEPAEWDRFLDSQPDLGPKWVPAFVRVADELPTSASMKIDKRALRRDAWRCDGVLWRPARGEGLRPLTDDDRRRLDPLLG
jgi:fatty-acyl-CoA synthase